MTDRILLAHGGGGSLMQQLIRQELLPLYGHRAGEPQPELHDAARLALPHGRLAFSCDGYVVQPLEFPGGDIGKLAVIGTANDLAMAAARPRHLSVSLILEEGLPLALLRRVVASMAAAAEQCGLRIVTGDTKVVERGKADGLFISTSGVGTLEQALPVRPAAIRPGDQLLLSGDLGRHGVAILAARHGLDLQPPVLSDCAPLWPQVEALLRAGITPHCLRDLTRGGLASALQELAEGSGLELQVREADVPVIEPVARGVRPARLRAAAPGQRGALSAGGAAAAAADGPGAAGPSGGVWIGTAAALGAGQSPRVLLRTALGTERLLLPSSGELLPRIC
jgi:hydrogenase expression/formation protein HypE